MLILYSAEDLKKEDIKFTEVHPNDVAYYHLRILWLGCFSSNFEIRSVSSR